MSEEVLRKLKKYDVKHLHDFAKSFYKELKKGSLEEAQFNILYTKLLSDSLAKIPAIKKDISITLVKFNFPIDIILKFSNLNIDELTEIIKEYNWISYYKIICKNVNLVESADYQDEFLTKYRSITSKR